MSIEIANLVAALGGEVVGKIRLQKMVYLLDQVGLQSGFSYSYHYYGPYSAGLSDAADIESFFGDLKEEQRNRVSDGVPYVVYKSSNAIDNKTLVGAFNLDKITRFGKILAAYSSTELELAATAFWIANEEEILDWKSELKKRKGVKTEGGRTDKALNLLNELELSL